MIVQLQVCVPLLGIEEVDYFFSNLLSFTSTLHFIFIFNQVEVSGCRQVILAYFFNLLGFLFSCSPFQLFVGVNH